MQIPAKIRQNLDFKNVWRIFWLLLAYSFIWYILSGAKPASWIVGVPAVLLSVGVTLFLSPRSYFALNPVGACIFIPYFIYLSIISGIDVMRRTLSADVRINPGILTYKTDLTGVTRVMLANTISLLPGTLSADMHENEIRVHVLDVNTPVRENLQKLENRITRIFLRHTPEGEKQ